MLSVITTFGYDLLGRIVSAEQPATAKFTYSYGSVISVYDPTTVGFGGTAGGDPGNRNITSVKDPCGCTTTYIWENNQIVAVVDALGNRTTNTYTTVDNGTARLKSIENPLNNRFTYNYDSNSRLKSTQSWGGTRTTFLWDSFGNLKAVINALGDHDFRL